jgi:hypothetical protein
MGMFVYFFFGEKDKVKGFHVGWDMLIGRILYIMLNYYKKKFLVVLKGNNSSRVLSENVGRLHLE